MAKSFQCPDCGVHLDAGDQAAELAAASTEIIVEDLFAKLQQIGPTEDAAIVLSALGDSIGVKATVIVDGEITLARASMPTVGQAISLAVARAHARLEAASESLAQQDAIEAAFIRDLDEEDE